jgi:hypothetical protein
MAPRPSTPVATCCLALALAACGATVPVGVTRGALDTHCLAPDGGPVVQPTDEAVCHQAAGADAGAPEAVVPLFNGEGDDADCKYHVTLSTAAVARNQDVTFTVKATHRTDGRPLLGADTYLDASLTDVHPAPNTAATTTESPGGTYTIGPLRFDQPGRWVVEAHFFHHCTDALEDSPHAHAAFFVDVP